MKKAAVIFQSKTGITEKFGKEISNYITNKGIDSKAIPVSEYKTGMADEADFVLLGCWTAGFMLLFQHPDSRWKQFAKQLPQLTGKKIALFTTYKIATGSMFKSMRKFLGDNAIVIELKSKKGNLSEDNKAILDRFLQN
jgi:flavodoxin